MINHPLVMTTEAVREDLWGFMPDTNARITAPPAFEWIGWNPDLDAYSTIIVTYPLAWISLFIVPFGYGVQIIYLFFMGNPYKVWELIV